MCQGSRLSSRRGFTLAEVLIASATLAFVVAAISQAIVAGQMQSYAALREECAIQLAEALLEEILSKPMADPDGTSGETARTNFDDMRDYHGYREDLGAVSDAAGAAYPSPFTELARSATVIAATRNLAELGTHDGLAITVTVTDDHGRAWSVARFVPE